jgi:hypothetical protein
VHDHIWFGCIQDSPDCLSIAKIALVEGSSVDYGTLMTAPKVVQDSYLMSGLDRLFDGDAPDVSSSASYKYSHALLLPESSASRLSFASAMVN